MEVRRAEVQQCDEVQRTYRQGCDRSTPKGLVRLLPTLSAFGYIHLGNWHELRSQIPLMGRIPDTTSPDHTEFQDALATRNRPRHPRAFEPLRKDNFTGHLGGLVADGPGLTSVGLKAHPTTALVQIRRDWRIDLGLVPQVAMVPQSRRRR